VASAQVYINYKKQSTMGWNIWTSLLDFTGGVGALCQMFLEAGETDRLTV
jgi:PQ loop repeat